MTDPLTAVASLAAVTQLAGQVIVSVNKLYSLWKQVKDAPKDLEYLLKDIRSTAKILGRLPAEDEELSLILKDPLENVKDILFELETLVLSLANAAGAKKLKGKLWLECLRFAMRSKEVYSLIAKLERAEGKIGLALEVNGHITRREDRILQREQYTMMQNVLLLLSNKQSIDVVKTEETTQYAITDIQKEENGTITDIQRTRKTKIFRKSYGWWGIGYVQTTCIASTNSHQNLMEVEKIETKFLPAAYLGFKGFSFLRGLDGGQWKYWFEPVRIVQDSAPIFQACKTGSLHVVIELCEQRKASVYDATTTGLTPLHIAAAHCRPEVCKWLIMRGANGNATDTLVGGTPLHYAARESGGDFSPTLDGGSLTEAVDNISRPKDALDTFRVLVEKGKCDPMLKLTACGVFARMTPLHLYSGLEDSFLFLLNQDEFCLDLAERDQDGSTVLESMLLNQLPRAAGTANILLAPRTSAVYASPTFDTEMAMFSAIQKLFFAIRKNHRQKILRLNHEKSSISNTQQDIKSCTLLLQNILQLGVDVHARDFDGRTPFTALIAQLTWGHIIFKTLLNEMIITWFQLLSNHGYELQHYIREEGRKQPETSFSSGTFIGNGTEYVQLNDVRRHITLSPGPVENEVLFELRLQYFCGDIFAPHYKCSCNKIPGSWKSDIRQPCECLELKEWKEVEMTFLIVPLRDGVQEFTLWNEFDSLKEILAQSLWLRDGKRRPGKESTQFQGLLS